MSTHPTILGDMVRNEGEKDDRTSLDVERDLGTPTGIDSDTMDVARDLAIPPSDLPDAERQPDTAPGHKQSK
ncbi:hypothetical protein [Paracoccus sp. MC1862]|uniref:hypothetical protein n=1 Tax=Paracoccus sp. MC1862 TaxID=2760307 RepID=UPI0016022043|nr:hypothetical protein [Paracoccus sp. MC1862]MBB1497293.1 hypothetical protein [Paracoccus sp. MC1862]QQO44741.1 hypothetical protein JGR78_15655 [Paracoccus sp. MC1862]